MNIIDLENYNLHWTLMGGQSFAWDYDEEEKAYYGFTQDKAIKLKLDDNKLFWQTYPQKDDFDFLKSYLRLDEDYENILKKINKDKHVNTAISNFPNLRLLNQDFEQCLLSFILSSTNNIRSIRASVRMLNQKFGDKINIDRKEVYLFPQTERIAEASIEDLLQTKIGFRAKYLKDSANKILKENFSEKIKTLGESGKRDLLITLNGVGTKIADCTMVFSLKTDNITPLDVWGKRVFIDLYKLDPKMKYDDMRIWIDKYFEGHAAWAGQFLFENIRTSKKKSAR